MYRSTDCGLSDVEELDQNCPQRADRHSASPSSPQRIWSGVSEYAFLKIVLTALYYLYYREGEGERERESVLYMCVRTYVRTYVRACARACVPERVTIM